MFGCNKHDMPKKPKTNTAKIDLVWDAVFNHLPTQLRWVNLKMNFIIAFMALILGLLGLIIALVV